MSALFLLNHLLRAVTVFCCACVLASCVYKLDIQQGNVLDRSKVEQVKPGMTKRQVRYLLGTPLIVDTFNQNRWDYFYSMRDYRPGDSEGRFSQERLTLFFENEVVSKIDNKLADSVMMPGQEHRAQEAAQEKPIIPDATREGAKPSSAK